MSGSTTSTAVRQVWTSDEGTMAYETARKRWPRIVQDMVNEVALSCSSLPDGSPERVEGASIQQQLASLKDDIVNDARIEFLRNDGGPNIELWNQQLSQVGTCSWLASPWLFGECWMYRLVKGIFSSTAHWTTYDVFKQQKDSTIVKSRVVVDQLATRFIQIKGEIEVPTDISLQAKKVLFIEMTQIALWGNTVDLSLLQNLSVDVFQDLQGQEAILRNLRNVVDNDTDEVWQHLSQNEGKSSRMDIVLDNAGFELFTDILYATYLLESKLASEIVLHVKDFEWFVSDATTSDVDSLVENLASYAVFPNRKDIDALLCRLRNQFESGAIRLRKDEFWTTSLTFQQMPQMAHALLKELQTSTLVIFKGDLNYRKLTADGLWPHTTPFKEALGPMGAQSGLKVLALRTNKADVCVGVEHPEKVRELESAAPGGAWVRNGKYAVISFSDGF